MNIEDLQILCKKFPGVTQDIKWEDHLCFNVGEKMFIVTSPDTFPVTASIKVTDEEFELLTSQEGITPSAYLGRYKWIHIDDINRWSKKEWEKYAKMSYCLVASKLPVKTRKLIKFEE